MKIPGTKKPRALVVIAGAALVLVVALIAVAPSSEPDPPDATATSAAPVPPPAPLPPLGDNITRTFMRNVDFFVDPEVVLQVKWLDGTMPARLRAP